jgi:hypothetical protein
MQCVAYAVAQPALSCAISASCAIACSRQEAGQTDVGGKEDGMCGRTFCCNEHNNSVAFTITVISMKKKLVPQRVIKPVAHLPLVVAA